MLNLETEITEKERLMGFGYLPNQIIELEDGSAVLDPFALHPVYAAERGILRRYDLVH